MGKEAEKVVCYSQNFSTSIVNTIIIRDQIQILTKDFVIGGENLPYTDGTIR